MSSSGDLPYAGDLSAQDAYRLLEGRPDAVLVDVRTRAEWTFVGVPDLSAVGKQPRFVEWQSFPPGTGAGDFVAALEGQLAAGGVDREAPILFLCRSGARSRAAAIAMTQSGWRQCFNVADGFEGPLDAEGHRGTVAGWKVSNLPWAQS